MAGLRCLFCTHVNPAGARFCNDCGSPADLQPCRVCNAVDKRTASHCYQCGAAFPPPLPLPADAVVDATADATVDAPVDAPVQVAAEPRPLPEPSLVAGYAASGSASLATPAFVISAMPADGGARDTTVLRAGRAVDRQDGRKRSAVSYLAVVAALGVFAVVAAALHRFGGEGPPQVLSQVGSPAADARPGVTVGPPTVAAERGAAAAPEPPAAAPAPTSTPTDAAGCDPAVAALGLCRRRSEP
ncbi:MAG TPA: zinc ribbon domain-containing protein [Casimicrobiaceae bacterium]|nr:zinc ribbon domain-containing protein [Casimicrobiaceae bacterium]